jgi:hypothetical protein
VVTSYRAQAKDGGDSPIGLRGEAVPLALRAPGLGHTSGAATPGSNRDHFIASESGDFREFLEFLPEERLVELA